MQMCYIIHQKQHKAVSDVLGGFTVLPLKILHVLILYTANIITSTAALMSSNIQFRHSSGNLLAGHQTNVSLIIYTA